MKATRRRIVRWDVWCGFQDDRPALAPSAPLLTSSGDDLNQYGIGLFRSRKKARGGYLDVRRVEIRVVEAPGQARRIVARATELTATNRTPTGCRKRVTWRTSRR